MPVPSVTFRSELDGTTRKELDQLTAENTEYLLQEHDDDGKHTDIHATSITLTKNDAKGATGNVTAPGTGPHAFGGPIQAKQWIDLDPSGSTPPEPTWGAPLTNLVGGQMHLGQVGAAAGNMTIGPGLRMRCQVGPNPSDWHVYSAPDAMLLKPALWISLLGGAYGWNTPIIIRANEASAYEIVPHYRTKANANVMLGSRYNGYGSNYEGFTEVNADRIDARTAFYERGRTVPVGEWQNYTPTIGDTNTPALALGNGGISGRYAVIGRACHYKIHFNWGSTSNFGGGGAAYLFGLPLPTTAFFSPAGSGLVMTGGIYYGHTAIYNDATHVYLIIHGSSSTYYKSYPAAAAAGDIVYIGGTYEV